jgi:tetratricopeptide (TPR) repeat protein
MRPLRVLFFALLFIPFCGYTQSTDWKLAQLYYGKGEYDKALPYMEKIFSQEPTKTNFMKYYDCLLRTDNRKEAEKMLKKQVSANRYDYEYPIMLGIFYENENELDKANKIYEKLVDDLPPNANAVVQLYNSFRTENKNQYALATLQRGEKLLRGAYPLQIQFADYYGAVGETNKMLDSYLDLLKDYPNYMVYVQNVLARKIEFNEDNKELEYLRTALLEKSQKNPDNHIYANMLIWYFIQKRSFSAALNQVIAMDKREQGMGYRVYELGEMCLENKAYEVGRRAFQYVIELGRTPPFYNNAELRLLNARYLEITEEKAFDQNAITAAIGEYQSALQRLGKRQTTAGLILEMAHLEAFYANKADSAIFHLEQGLLIPGITDMQRAELKMELADIQVLQGDIWSASLYYMQVDKDFKYEPIGEEAKFKNAKIFYYDGEFEFAESQLNVLKEATSKLIANDAMELALLITENYGLDSNYEAMYWYAQGDLYIEQHQYEKAFLYFDSITENYQTHSLGDDILMRKSEAMFQQGKWNEGIAYLNELLKFYAFDLLADDAVFMLGDVYENHLHDSEKAAGYYKQILFDYKGSMHTIEARKRFRKLRGDKTDENEI